MSKFLQDILANNHPLFSFNIAQLEKASGDSGVDARLVGDITGAAHVVMRHIGIDPADTSAEELYHALNSMVQREQLLELATTQYVVLPFADGPVSFNLLDVIENAHHGLSFAGRQVGHGQRSVRLEIIRRYAEHDRTSNDLVHHLAEQIGLKLESDSHYIDIDRRLEAGPAALLEAPEELQVSESPAEDAPSLLMIGDIFTDAFIKLNESAAKIIKQDDGTEWLALPFGQKPPYDQVDIVRSVGPSPNAAVSASRLGLNASLMAWVGDDATGEEALDHLKQEHVNTDVMVVEKGKLTSYWYVLRYGADRTMLVKSEKYRYEWHAPEKTPDWIYLSYIGEDSWPLHEALIEYLNEHPDIKLAFQPGTFHFKWGREKLAGIYKRAHIIIVNREEAVDITGASHDDLKALTKALHDLGPQVVVITDGPNGSYASYDWKLVTIPNYPDPAPPLDRTGAGDAFASTIVSGLALGKSMDEALTWAPINSMSVVQALGAQAGLLHQTDIKKYLGQAPEDYRVSEL